MEAIWASGDYTGSQRPIVRATLQHPSMKLRTVMYRPFPTSTTSTTGTPGTGLVRGSRNTKSSATDSGAMPVASTQMYDSPNGPAPAIYTNGPLPVLAAPDDDPVSMPASTAHGDAGALSDSKLGAWFYNGASHVATDTSQEDLRYYIPYLDKYLAEFVQTFGPAPATGGVLGVAYERLRTAMTAERTITVAWIQTNLMYSGKVYNGMQGYREVLLARLERALAMQSYNGGLPAAGRTAYMAQVTPVALTGVVAETRERLRRNGGDPLGDANSSTAGGSAKNITDVYADLLWSDLQYPVELPNIKSVSWSRSLDTDVAECTLTLWNTAPLPIGETPLPDQLDTPGSYTFNRGTASLAGSDRWGHKKNSWYAQVMPDNIIRTFEGYGFDPAVCPERDENLQPSGVWMIDDVTMNTDGTISVKCRDLGRILLDQILTGPIVPDDFDPVAFTKAKDIYETINHYEGGGVTTTHTETRQVKDPPTTVAGRLGVRMIDTSVSAWRVGTSGSGGPGTVKDPNNYAGHSPVHAIDNDPATFWLSVGNSSPRASFAYEWVELGVDNANVSQVRIRTVKAGYTAYVSLKVGGTWIGASRIDYHEANIGRNGSNIPFVASSHVPNEDITYITFPEASGVTNVRVTLANLQRFDTPSSPYKYRGGIREIEVWNTRTQATETTHTETVTTSTTSQPSLRIEKRKIPTPAGATPGWYCDYTDIVKLLLAWAGCFYTTDGYQLLSDGTKRKQGPKAIDEYTFGPEAAGAVYGDFQQTGTTGKVDITHDNFHMKPVMDGIQTVKNILLFNFYFDEEGYAQWRQPNLTNIGNWISRRNTDTRPHETPVWTRKMYTLDETKVLVSLAASITSKSVREGILTYNPQTKNGFVTKGYNPNPTGLRRLAGWPNPAYDSDSAMQLTGELIAQRQLQAYRQDSIVIPGFPALQIDDQIRIAERVTSEGYLHYIKGIECNLDISDGTYQYTISTHWLGEDPATNWWIDTSTMMPPKTAFAGDPLPPNPDSGGHVYHAEQGPTPLDGSAYSPQVGAAPKLRDFTTGATYPDTTGNQR